MDLPEFQTRIQKIDVLLKEQGWDVADRLKVKLEVDTKQSDFIAYNYKTVKDTLKNDLDSKYADYLLLDSAKAPLAIIEAKRTSKDPRLGQRQAEEYANDIKEQTGKDVFIFLTNGYEIYFWDRERYSPRQVKGFFTRNDLERLRFQKSNLCKIGQIEIDTSIVDRPKSIECTKRVIEHIHKGNRKALVVMATGTGKTRVAMAIIDALMREGLAQRVLFLADRRALRDQAYDDGFKRFFPEEAKDKILSGDFDSSKRLYASTIQTFMEIYDDKVDGEFKISPAEFDVVISDEAHRSIYNKWKDVFTYLDSIQIGLTATPAEFVERDTFRFFQCREGIPTAMYSYDDAVKDGILCDFRQSIIGAQTHFQIKGINPEDLTEMVRRELMEKGVNPDDFNFEGTELEKKVAVKGTSEAIVREFMDQCQVDQSGTLPAKSIIFAISKTHARRIQDAFDLLYPEHRGNLARVIVSDDQRASALIKAFKDESFPRVAISVDMLDTGIDVPEVCNLVFAKPVFSKIKFWQMLGRGTRCDAACKHKEWLPNGRKEYFKVFDFWKNFEYWKMNPEGVKNEPVDAITTRIFLTRINQLVHARKYGDKELTEKVKEKIKNDIKSLPKDNINIREKEQDLDRALSLVLWNNVAVDPVEYLVKNIMPLMRYKQDVNLNEASFTLKCEKLALAVLKHDDKQMEFYKEEIGKMAYCLPATINDVRLKKDEIDSVQLQQFWDHVSYDDSQRLIKDLGPLMQYMQKEPPEIIVIDIDDEIEQRTLWDFMGVKEQKYEARYREIVEDRIKELADNNEAIQKIKAGQEPTDADLQKLEATVFQSGTDGGEIDASEKKGLLVKFIKHVLGISSLSDTENRIRDSFHTYMIENNKHYNADQLNFIRTIQTVFMKKKHLDMVDLWEAPFTNFGNNAPVPMFDENDLKAFIGICKGLEKELFKAEA
jgi:type I restriction enzyme R subunit